MPKLKVCEREFCDYLPCVEQKIVELELQGLDAGATRDWLTELRQQERRMAEAEAEWFAAIDKGVALV